MVLSQVICTLFPPAWGEDRQTDTYNDIATYRLNQPKVLGIIVVIKVFIKKTT